MGGPEAGGRGQVVISDFRDMHQEVAVLGEMIVSTQDIDLGSYQKPVSVGSIHFLYEDTDQSPAGRQWNAKVS